jgi:xanthine dehydrogenase accessory factor
MGLYARLAELQASGGRGVLVTVIRAQGSVPRHAGSKMLVLPDGSQEGTIGGGTMEHQVAEQALETLKDGQLRIRQYAFRDPGQGDVGVCGGEIEVLMEPIQPKPTLLIIGAGHVGSAVAHLGKWLGFRVVVSDDRPEFADPATQPNADEVVQARIGDLPSQIDIGPETYVLLTTRGVDLDVEGLPALLATPAAYIGVIGSRRRWETTAAELRKTGVADDLIQRVTSPMGLELNAETPEEIAVSMLAQVIMLRRGGTGEAMAHSPTRRKGKGAASP